MDPMLRKALYKPVFTPAQSSPKARVLDSLLIPRTMLTTTGRIMPRLTPKIAHWAITSVPSPWKNGVP